MERVSEVRQAARAIGLTGMVLLLVAGLAAGAATKTGLTQPIDINQASASELTALPGIGEAMAKRIVQFREEHGPFKRPEDLMKVKGIGEKSFQKLRALIKISRSVSGS